MTTRTVAFGLGANLGDPAAVLRGAVAALSASDLLTGVEVSPLYRTAPVGGPPQPDYLNAVLVARSSAEPRDLLELSRQTEVAFGRTRSVRWGPRTLDVDVLAVGDLTSDDPEITVPHPRAGGRAFVLLPWSQVDPGFIVPGLGSVADLLAALGGAQRAGVVELPGGRAWAQQESVR